MNKKPEYQFKSLYYDNSRQSIIRIIMVDRITVQCKVISDDSETEYTKEEVIHFIESGLWVEHQIEKKKEPFKNDLTPAVKDSKVVESKQPVYIESLKDLKSGKQSLISINKEPGWLQADLIFKENKLEIDLSNLDSENIKKIMEILNK